MPHSDTGERVTPVLDFPSRDGLVVNAIRVDYEPAEYTPRHSSGHVDRLPAIPSYELSGMVEEVGPAAPASRPATRCSRSRRSTATASQPTTRRCPPS